MIIGVHALGPLARDTGGRTYITNFVKFGYLSPPESKVILFMSSGQYTFLPDLPPHFRIVQVPFSHQHSFLRVLAEHLVLPILILIKQIDVMYFPGNVSSFWTPVPYVLAIRSMLAYIEKQNRSVDTFRQLYRSTLLPRAASKAFSILTPSAHTKREIQEYLKIPPGQIHVVPHGIDHELFGYFDSEADGQAILANNRIRKPYLLYVSALWKYKNHDLLIDVFADLIREKQLPHQLVLVGQGMNSYSETNSRLQQQIVSNNLENRVIFINFLPHSELCWIYKHADVFVFPSEIESFGNSLYEAMAAGTPVVCSDRHGFREMLGDSAALVDPHDRKAFGNLLWEVISDTRLRQDLIRKGSALAAGLRWENSILTVFSNLKMACDERT